MGRTRVDCTCVPYVAYDRHAAVQDSESFEFLVCNGSRVGQIVSISCALPDCTVV